MTVSATVQRPVALGCGPKLRSGYRITWAKRSSAAAERTTHLGGAIAAPWTAPTKHVRQQFVDERAGVAARDADNRLERDADEPSCHADAEQRPNARERHPAAILSGQDDRERERADDSLTGRYQRTD